MENPKTQKAKSKKWHRHKNIKNKNSLEDSFLKIKEYNSSNKSSEIIQDENSINLNYIDTTIYPFAQKIPIKTLRNNEYIYVNSKQYSRILKRREERKKYFEMFENENFLNKKSKYHHESRHKHAMNRERGKGGRFLSKKEKEILEKEKNENKSDPYKNTFIHSSYSTLDDSEKMKIP